MILARQKPAVEKPHCFPLFLILVITGILSASPVMADSISNAPAQISCIEQALNGQSRPDLPLQARLENLESTVFGHKGSGALKDRIIQLKNYLGVEEKARTQAAATAAKSTASKTVIAGKTTALNNAAKQSTAKATSIPRVAAQTKQATSLKKINGYQPMPIPKVAELPPKESKAVQAEKSPAKTDAITSQNQTDSAQSALYQDNEDLASMMSNAMNLYRDGKVAQAEKAFRKVLKQYPDCVDAYYNLGSIAEHKGDKQTAIDYYSKALYISPNDKQLQEAITQLGGKSGSDPGSNTIAQARNANSKGDTELKGDAVDNIGVASSAPRDFSTNCQSAQQQWTAPNRPHSHSAQTKALQTAVSVGGTVLRYSLMKAISSMH